MTNGRLTRLIPFHPGSYAEAHRLESNYERPLYLPEDAPGFDFSPALGCAG